MSDEQTMLMRVARAIYHCQPRNKPYEALETTHRRYWEWRAQAAIRALRESTDRMNVAGGLKCEALMFEGESSGIIFEDMGTVFAAMIDAALTEDRA